MNYPKRAGRSGAERSGSGARAKRSPSAAPAWAGLSRFFQRRRVAAAPAGGENSPVLRKQTLTNFNFCKRPRKRERAQRAGWAGGRAQWSESGTEPHEKGAEPQAGRAGRRPKPAKTEASEDRSQRNQGGRRRPQGAGAEGEGAEGEGAEGAGSLRRSGAGGLMSASLTDSGQSRKFTVVIPNHRLRPKGRVLLADGLEM